MSSGSTAPSVPAGAVAVSVGAVETAGDASGHAATAAEESVPAASDELGAAACPALIGVTPRAMTAAAVAATIDAAAQFLCRFIVRALLRAGRMCRNLGSSRRSQPCQPGWEHREHDGRPRDGVLNVVVEIGEVETVVERAQQQHAEDGAR